MGSLPFLVAEIQIQLVQFVADAAVVVAHRVFGSTGQEEPGFEFLAVRHLRQFQDFVLRAPFESGAEDRCEVVEELPAIELFELFGLSVLLLVLQTFLQEKTGGREGGAKSIVLGKDSAHLRAP